MRFVALFKWLTTAHVQRTGTSSISVWQSWRIRQQIHGNTTSIFVLSSIHFEKTYHQFVLPWETIFIVSMFELKYRAKLLWHIFTSYLDWLKTLVTRGPLSKKSVHFTGPKPCFKKQNLMNGRSGSSNLLTIPYWFANW